MPATEKISDEKEAITHLFQRLSNQIGLQHCGHEPPWKSGIHTAKKQKLHRGQKMNVRSDENYIYCSPTRNGKESENVLSDIVTHLLPAFKCSQGMTIDLNTQERSSIDVDDIRETIEDAQRVLGQDAISLTDEDGHVFRENSSVGIKIRIDSLDKEVLRALVQELG